MYSVNATRNESAAVGNDGRSSTPMRTRPDEDDGDAHGHAAEGDAEREVLAVTARRQVRASRPQ